MKFVVVTYGTAGDTRPLAALTRALIDAGHAAHLLADAATLGSAATLGVPASFAAATIVVITDQNVVSTGPYAVARHPMYSGALVMLFGTPLALGSSWGLVMFIPMIFIIAWRARDEERFLLKNLSGYKDYCQAVRYRLVPFVW